MSRRDKKEWTRTELLRLSSSYWQGCALQAGVRLGVFGAVASGGMTAREIAEKVQGDPRGVALLLNALSAMGLLVHEGERYANTPAADSLLVRESPGYIGHVVSLHYHLMAAWSRLDTAVRSGKPVRKKPTRDEAERESFLMGMFNLAMDIAPRLAERLDLAGRRRLLDLGGGPGTYAVHFCLANPGLRATVYDLSTTRPFAEKIISEFGVADRVEFTAGDYVRGKINGTYDVAWLSQILHSVGPGDARKIVEKAVSALVPGGLLLIHDFILEESLDAPLFPAVFSLNMLVNTDEGRSYSEGQLREIMKEAGLRDIRRFPFTGPNASGVLMGYR